jgi:hypothetical protein
LSLEDFIRRLIIKRPYSFYTDLDITLLRDGTQLNKASDWELVGSDNEGQLKLDGMCRNDYFLLLFEMRLIILSRLSIL